MSATPASGDQVESKEKPELQAGASCSDQSESLEDQLRLLHKQITNSDWLQNNTAEMWMEANPKAAAELKQIIKEKQALQNPPQSQSESESQSSSSQSPSSGESSTKS